MGVGRRSDFIYQIEEEAIPLDGRVLVEGFEEGMFKIGGVPCSVGGFGKRGGGSGQYLRAGSFSEEVFEGEGVGQHPC